MDPTASPAILRYFVRLELASAGRNAGVIGSLVVSCDIVLAQKDLTIFPKHVGFTYYVLHCYTTILYVYIK